MPVTTTQSRPARSRDGQPGGYPAPRFTPGYWANHEAATTALLPQTLGEYTVTGFGQAAAIFTAMQCGGSGAVGQLALA